MFFGRLSKKDKELWKSISTWTEYDAYSSNILNQLWYQIIGIVYAGAITLVALTIPFQELTWYEWILVSIIVCAGIISNCVAVTSANNCISIKEKVRHRIILHRREEYKKMVGVEN